MASSSRREQGRRLRSALDPAIAGVRAALGRTLELGVAPGSPVDACKRIRLANLLALWGSAIMVPWAAIEALFGDVGNVPWEVGFLGAFLAVLTLNAMGSDRAARLLLIVTANASVFAGALMFDDDAGGTLPFFGLVALPLLLFGPADSLLLAAGAALPPLLFTACETGLAARLLSVHAKPAPGWYFAANVASAFAVAFVVPLFFYRSNQRAEAQLERVGREKLKRLLDADLIGVVRGKLPGTIVEANDTFLNLLGVTRAELGSGALDPNIFAPLAHGPRSVSERTFVRREGTPVPALVGVARLDEEDDEVVGFVLDLTAQKRVEAQKTMLRDSAEALRLRDLFASIASHELKTPLTTLLLSLKAVSRRLETEAPASTTLRTQVERCEGAAMRLGDLIRTLLDVAQIEDGKLRLKMRDIDMVQAVRRVVSGFDAAVPAGVPQIDVQADATVPAHLDPLRFDQVLINLLSNALKYGDNKRIQVRVRNDRAAGMAHLEVIDHGHGIDPSMTERIFDPFQRAVSPDETIPGLGLGLYVVKTIVDGHGGRIRVESEPGCGSRFVVDLPGARSTGADVGPRPYLPG
jgi:signal transduction histidine kinase